MLRREQLRPHTNPINSPQDGLTLRLQATLRNLFRCEMDARQTIATIEECITAYLKVGKLREAKTIFYNVIAEKSVINRQVSNINALLEGYCTLSIRSLLFVASLFSEQAMTKNQILTVLQPLNVTTLNFAADLRLFHHRLQQLNHLNRPRAALPALNKMISNLAFESSAAELMQLICDLYHHRYRPHCRFLEERSLIMPFFSGNGALMRTHFTDIYEDIWRALMQKMEHISANRPIELDEIDYADFRNRCLGRVFNSAFSLLERLDSLQGFGLLVVRPEPSKMRP